MSGLDDWPEHLQSEAKEMLKRNARVFSKTDMDMGRTNLVKHHIKLTDPVPFKESYRRIPPQMYDEVKVHNPGSRNCAIFVHYVNSSELHL